MSVVAIIPARAGSKGIPNKNFRELCGVTPVERAIHCAHQAGIFEPVFTSDACITPALKLDIWSGHLVRQWAAICLPRPVELSQDDTPMIDVVKHVLAEIPGPDDQVIVLLQPTQPMRRAEHVTRAIELLRETQADSVVSVVQLPLTHSPDMACDVAENGVLRAWWCEPISATLARRQDARPAYIRDGTVYCFWRATVTRCGDIYGSRVRALVIPAAESCPLDTPEDWAEAERRLSQR